VIAAATLGALFFAQPSGVHASESVDSTPREHVFYGDLDLNNSAGVRRLHGRLNQAARKVCASYTNSVRPDHQRLHAECIAKAVSGAMTQIGKTPPLQAGR
jgi:UrcA family protein